MKSRFDSIYVYHDAAVLECWKGYFQLKQIWCRHKNDDRFITVTIYCWKEVYD